MFRDGGWIALSPQYKGTTRITIARNLSTRRAAERALDDWLNEKGEIVHRDLKPENKQCARFGFLRGT